MSQIIQSLEPFSPLLILPLSAIILKYWTFLSDKHRAAERERFKTYHELIKKLNQSDEPEVPIKLYRQVAIAYELRFYPRYRDVTIRIFDNWTRTATQEDLKEYDALYSEMNLTKRYLQLNRLHRFLWRLHNR